jgi:hypothetical protein
VTIQFASIEAGVAGPGIRGCFAANKRKLHGGLKCQFAGSSSHSDPDFCRYAKRKQVPLELMTDAQKAALVETMERRMPRHG